MPVRTLLDMRTINGEFHFLDPDHYTYTVSQKTRHQTLVHNFAKILTDFQSSFTVALSMRFTIKSSLKIPPHPNGVDTLGLPCKILMSENIPCPICWGTVFWNINSLETGCMEGNNSAVTKAVTVIGSIHLHSLIDEYQSINQSMLLFQATRPINKKTHTHTHTQDKHRQ